MKVLNRPMFRMGGPIKEGIMDGIKEPRRKYNTAGFVAPDFQVSGDPNKMAVNKLLQNQQNAAAAFENIFAPNVMASEVSLVPKKVEVPQKSIFQTTEDAFGDISGLSSDFDTTEKVGDKIITKQAKDFVGYEPGIDETTKEFIKGLGEPGVSEGYLKAKAKFENKDKSGEPYTDRIMDIAANRGKTTADVPLVSGDDQSILPETKKERVSKILDSLGYKRAQKNALYDAMIKAGQRISRTGLGAENLVSDVIAETSQSYDKPEKLREAAELMDVQQRLKLEQIDRSKDNRTSVEKLTEFYMSEAGGGNDRNVALRMARNLPTKLGEYFTASKASTDLGKVRDATANATADGFFGSNKEYKGKIEAKDFESISDFVKSDKFKGDGVYNVGGVAIVIENGKKVSEVVIQAKADKTGFLS